MKTLRRRTKASPAANEITWSHLGIARRVTAWPEVSFERQSGRCWVADQPDSGAFAGAAADVSDRAWQHYLEFMPLAERAFVAQFRFRRLEALQVVARCPELLPVLMEVPALTVFIAAHAALRGAERPAWEEISAVYERSGVFGLLEWLGLPATRQTLVALAHLSDPEIPQRFLSALRTALWNRPTAAAFERANVVTDLDLARHCHLQAA
jgi:hypothetical protein